MAHFEKKLSENTVFTGRVFSVSVDKVLLENGGKIVGDKYYIPKTDFRTYDTVKIKNYNFETGDYETLLDGKTACIPLEEDKKYFRIHPVVSPCHLSESGSVRIHVEYRFVEVSLVPYGFLGRKMKKEVHVLAPEEAELVTVLTAEQGARRYDNQDESDTDWMEFDR